jgi:hypothetical protein
MTDILQAHPWIRLRKPICSFISRLRASHPTSPVLATTAALLVLQTPAAFAQGAAFSAPSLETGAGGANPLLAQATPNIPIVPTAPRTSGTTILPTDVLPLPTIQNRMTFGENLQLRILQKLPARFYFSTSTETSLRFESNVFQFPKKRILLQKLGVTTPNEFVRLSRSNQQAIINTLKLADSQDWVFRVLPNVTAGYTLTPRTRLYGTFFFIRDSLFKNVRLNTDIYSYGYGIQQDIPIGSRANLQVDMQFRELNQMHQHSVFDFLPGLTLSVVATPRTVAYINALMQIRGRKYFQAPTRELDPFYTWGVLHQRGGWSFSASSTFVQNFREQFKHGAAIPANNYAMISDFEIARRLFRQLPGLQAFIRAEPIWNMHSHNRPGLAGMDFRLYMGMRFSASKPALTTALESLRRQLEEQEVTPPVPEKTAPKPSAFVAPEEYIAQRPQPIHGPLPIDIGNVHSAANLQDSLLTIHSEKLELLAPAVGNAYVANDQGGIQLTAAASPAQQLAEQEGPAAALVSESNGNIAQ